MVTHDVALKSLADRIIWMRDGKIQRIETNSPEKRQEAIRKLSEELEAITSKKKADHGLTTEFRAPTDYKTHLHYLKSTGCTHVCSH